MKLSYTCTKSNMYIDLFQESRRYDDVLPSRSRVCWVATWYPKPADSSLWIISSVCLQEKGHERSHNQKLLSRPSLLNNIEIKSRPGINPVPLNETLAPFQILPLFQYNAMQHIQHLLSVGVACGDEL